MQATGIELPYLAKPLAACGVPHAHSMSLITATQGLSACRTWTVPHILQQWIPHNGRLWKVYVIGSKAGPVVLECTCSSISADLQSCAGGQQAEGFTATARPRAGLCGL